MNHWIPQYVTKLALYSLQKILKVGFQESQPIQMGHMGLPLPLWEDIWNILKSRLIKIEVLTNLRTRLKKMYCKILG